MTILDAIDTTKDNKIELQELEKALDEWFFDNEENLLQIKKNLEENATWELVESLKTTLNSAIKEILIQEDFSDNDLRIIKLWNTLLWNNDEAKKETSEIVVFLNSLIPNLDISIDEIAKKTNFSDKDQRLCLVYRIILSYWGENQKIEELDLLIEKVQDTIMYNGLKEEIEKDANESLNNFAQNLVSLWVNIKQWFKWVNLTKDIKEPKDVNKITEDNIQNYLSLSPDIPKENYKYIVSNVQYLLAQHLAVYPKYVNHAKSWLGDAWWKMNIEHIQSSDEYMEKLFSYMAIFTKKPESEQIKEIAQRMLNPKSNLDGFNNFYVFNLWAQSLGDEKFQKILPKIFEKIPVNQCQAFFTFCKNVWIVFLNGAYIDYILKKENWLKEYWWTHNLIDMKKLQEFSILKWWSPEFDSLFDNTQKIKEMYDALKPLHIDISIPLNDVQSFFNGKAVHESKISQLKIQRKQAFENEVNRQNTTHATLSMMWPGAARMTERGERTAATNPYDKKIQEEYIALEKDYVTLLLKSKTFKKDLFNWTIGIENGPKWRIQWLSSAGVILDFSKWNNPDSIVRDRFWEMTQDQWNQFLWNMDNDKQAAFGSFVWMVWWIAWASAATVITWATNPFVTWAWFTVGLRLWNGLWQEVWNTWEWIYEKASWNTISNGNNKVEAFWQWFLRGVWWLDSDYNEVWISKFVSQLGFDYVASAATFGLSQKFWWFLWKLEGVKFAGWALKFGMEELIIENFLVDIPNNIIQTWFETLTGIDNKIMVWNTVVGQKTWLENERETKAGSFSDMLSVMWDACKQNFSFENMSQTFFNTVVYGWLLEWGGAAIRKIKSHLPSGQVADFEAKSAASVAALAGFTKFLTDSNITVDEKTGALIDAKTWDVLTKTDPRIPKYEAQWKNVQTTWINTIASLETLIETQKKIVADPNNPKGLLFRLWLISPTNSPLNIIDKKLDIIEKKIKEAEKKWDTKKIEKLEALKKEYAKAQIMLNVWNISGEFNKQRYEQSKKDIKHQSTDTSDESKTEIEIKNPEFSSKISQEFVNFSKNNPFIVEKIEAGTFNFLGKNVENLYKNILENTLKWKSETEHKTLIDDFNTRFSQTLEFFSDKNPTNKEDGVKFLKDWRLITSTITEYWKSLLWENFEASPTKKAFFDKLKSSMFYQHLDNPLKYCSHGADHTILVDAYVQNVISWEPRVLDQVQEKYWVDKEWAVQLLRLSAIFHDFWYPDIWDLAKAMHWPFGWVHFVNEFASEWNSTFIDFIKNDLQITDKAKIDQLVIDMRDAIFFHSADKVEKAYFNKVSYTKWSFLVWDIKTNGIDDFVNILTNDSWDWVITIYYRKWSTEWEINAKEFQKKIEEKYSNMEWRIKIEEDSGSYNYGAEFSEITKEGKMYIWREWKVWDIGIEFKPIDLLTDPLSWIVRLADNMDMSYERLTKIQSHTIFMNLFYNIGYEYKLENGETNTNSASYIYQQMEKLNKLDEKLEEWKVTPEEYNNLDTDKKKDHITQEMYDTQYSEISGKIWHLIAEANKNWWIEITVFNEKTWKPEPGWNFRVEFNNNFLKEDWKVDLYTYKSFVIDKLAEHKWMSNDADIGTIKNIAIDDDISSYSFRHFIGLTPVKDVTIESTEVWSNLVVKVNKDIYLNPDLWSQKLVEKGWFDNRPVVEYHIRRLFDASWRVSVDWELLWLKIVDNETWEMIWYAFRESAQDKFGITYVEGITTP